MKLLALLGGLLLPAVSLAANSTFLNPVLPGWHSDPSCLYHKASSTFFCATSTFIAFPGIPIYASKDLINWKLVSHVWNRESQLPGQSWNTTGQMDGMYAPTLRFHDEKFWVVCEYIGDGGGGQILTGLVGVLFWTTDPYSDASWSDPVIFYPNKIDPDLFWDSSDNKNPYVATQSVILQQLDLQSGNLTPQPALSLWNGTGGVWPEGPHLYKKDGYYYLMIAEGGTALNHAIMISRARNITGPYEPYANNPILTNRKTREYFQTVGHGDLFQDGAGNWWGMCLATRGGPDWKVYPMGREAVLFPVTWEEGQWPVLQPVRGRMSGWPSLPAPSKDIPGNGPFNGDPDVYDFVTAGEPIPRNLMYWRVPRPGAITTTAKGLQLVPSRNNVTGQMIPGKPTPELSGQRGMAFIGRRQTDTLFEYTVDLVGFRPGMVGSEAGVTVFLTQLNHIDLGVAMLADREMSFRFRIEAPPGAPVPETKVVPVPEAWRGQTIRLHVTTPNTTHYDLSASLTSDPASKITVGTAWAGLVSGGTGPFTGVLLGIFNTCNGAGQGEECPDGGDKAYWQRWRYTGKGQEIAMNEVV
ncbi:Non-reducing end alpha-L-arabinofuranosidase BoGH43A [Echria macrotheca]|uniref:Non-reducing end alpha-L-arabinofuranosidase BoGH43A n=1 Tax=Echria macrotheca TaxID=438768 RepID=A0AAJ0BL96_9PEZI|nr:Non-reducing end alpha-L-arabinofuranosidase BoGH43A [Echria macrotheca]